MTNVNRYFGGHVYSMYRPDTQLMKQIVIKLGDMTSDDFKDAKLFVARIRRIADVASEKNCKLYVDAEQTYIQAAIESFGQQMTHQLNRENRTVVMNGYQAYLKRTFKVLPIEVQASQKMGFNLGIKLVRGAYMNEERMIAERDRVESPVWETIEGTHACYNSIVDLVIPQLKQNDMLFVASHNVETIEKAVGLALAHDRIRSVLFGQL